MKYTIAAREVKTGKARLVHASYINDLTDEPYTYKELVDAIESSLGRCNPVLVGLPCMFIQEREVA